MVVVQTGDENSPKQKPANGESKMSNQEPVTAETMAKAPEVIADYVRANGPMQCWKVYMWARSERAAVGKRFVDKAEKLGLIREDEFGRFYATALN